jgi:hypothetical protein
MFDAKQERSAVSIFFRHGPGGGGKIITTDMPVSWSRPHAVLSTAPRWRSLSPNDSTFLNFQGLTRVRNIFPEVSGDLFRKAAKVAISFDKGYVDLRDMQGTVVARGLPPTLPYTITDQDRQMFMRQLGGAFSQRPMAGQTVAGNIVGPSGTGGSSGSSSGGAGSTLASSTIAASIIPVGINSGIGVDPTSTLTTVVYTPPKLLHQATH